MYQLEIMGQLRMIASPFNKALTCVVLNIGCDNGCSWVLIFDIAGTIKNFYVAVQIELL